MNEDCNQTGCGVEMETRMAQLNLLQRRLAKRQAQFRTLRERSIVAKIDKITRLINSIWAPSPALSYGRAALPSDRRRLPRPARFN
jgi:hypothetical protein